MYNLAIVIAIWLFIGFLSANMFHWAGRKVFDKIDAMIVLISFLFAPFAFCSAFVMVLGEIGFFNFITNGFETSKGFFKRVFEKCNSIKNPYYRGNK